MSNLGKYQELTELAKKLGGVDELIKTIGDGAVAKAGPGIYRKAAATTAGLIVVGASVYKAAAKLYKVREVKLHNRTARAADAEAELRAALAERENSADTEPKHGEDGHDSG